MKTFYEMLQILNEGRIDGHHWTSNTWLSDYGAGDVGPYESFSASRVVLGEDDDEPFSAVVDIDKGHWKFGKGMDYGLYARGYVLTGEENPASEPEYDPPGKGHRGGVDFKNPGRYLENLHHPLKEQAAKWLDEEVIRYIDQDIKRGERYGD